MDVEVSREVVAIHHIFYCAYLHIVRIGLAVGFDFGGICQMSNLLKNLIIGETLNLNGIFEVVTHFVCY